MKKSLTLIAVLFSFSGLAQDYTLQEIQIDSLHGLREGAFTHGDIDGDGDIDLMIAGDTTLAVGQGSCTALYLNDGAGGFSKAYTNIVPIQNAYIKFVDVDNDGDLDISADGYSEAFGSYTSYIYRNLGNLGFVQIPNAYIPVSNEGTMDFADIDGDGDLDAVSSYDNNPATYTRVGRNDGTGTFSIIPLNGTCCGISEFADVDGDGDQDIISSGYTPVNTAYTRLYLNDGTGNYSESSGLTPMNLFFGGGFMDIDNDGDQDLLFAPSYAMNPSVYMNDGLGNYTVSSVIPYDDFVAYTVKIGDINADGAPDFLAQGQDQITNEFETRIYTNNWDLTFSLSTTNIPIISGSQGAIELLNIDSDPYLEILTSCIPTGSFDAVTALYDNSGYLDISTNTLDDFRVQPNPNSGMFEVFVQNPQQSELHILNLDGTLIHQQQLKDAKSTVQFDAPSGIYLVQVSCETGVQTKKVIVR